MYVISKSSANVLERSSVKMGTRVKFRAPEVTRFPQELRALD